MLCPKCNIEMSQTYEPYEERCSKCGYWFDHWTGKEVDLSPKPHDYEIEDGSGDDDPEQWERLEKQVWEHVTDAMSRGVTLDDLKKLDFDPDQLKDDFNQQF